MAGKCNFAHTLCELAIAPPEYKAIWKHGLCDRWLGQLLSNEQLDVLNAYYDEVCINFIKVRL